MGHFSRKIKRSKTPHRRGHGKGKNPIIHDFRPGEQESKEIIEERRQEMNDRIRRGQ